jgi:YbgC/YbaW family acyl-CoA thioester hydrolase
MIFHYPIFVEFGDIDSYGIIHNPMLLEYMERARVKFFLDQGLDIRPGVAPVGLVVRDINIRLKGQITMFNQLDMEVTTSDIDEYSFVFNYKIKRDGKTMVSASTQMAFIGLKEMGLIPIPEEQIEMLKKYEK